MGYVDGISCPSVTLRFSSIRVLTPSLLWSSRRKDPKTFPVTGVGWWRFTRLSRDQETVMTSPFRKIGGPTPSAPRPFRCVWGSKREVVVRVSFGKTVVPVDSETATSLDVPHPVPSHPPSVPSPCSQKTSPGLWVTLLVPRRDTGWLLRGYRSVEPRVLRTFTNNLSENLSVISNLNESCRNG